METIQSIKEECTGCSACYSICPKNAIEMKKNLEGFNYPIIYNSNCKRVMLMRKRGDGYHEIYGR